MPRRHSHPQAREEDEVGEGNSHRPGPCQLVVLEAGGWPKVPGNRKLVQSKCREELGEGIAPSAKALHQPGLADRGGAGPSRHTHSSQLQCALCTLEKRLSRFLTHSVRLMSQKHRRWSPLALGPPSAMPGYGSHSDSLASRGEVPLRP